MASERDAARKRLYLRWHPDKHVDEEQKKFANAVFRGISAVIDAEDVLASSQSSAPRVQVPPPPPVVDPRWADEFAKVPVTQRCCIVMDRLPGGNMWGKCLLCNAFWDEWHMGTEKHKKKLRSAGIEER